MTDFTYYSVAILLVAIPAWALVSGKALGVWWWRMSFTRLREPVAYCSVVAVQVVIFILFLFTGRSWHLR